MSPLIRSLLSLAALLVAVTGQDYCNTQVYGDVTDREVVFNTVTTDAGGGRVTADDICNSRWAGSTVVGEQVKACNNDHGAAPDIQEVNPPDFSPVDVTCSDGCPSGADVDITQYCSKDSG